MLKSAVALLAVVVVGCARADDPRVLVESYNRVVTEAYRRADPDLVESVASPAEARRLLGLIGVKQDLGVTLDATLLALDVSSSARTGDDLHVTTRERWRYRDRQIGTGAPVGAESTDDYELDYHFRRYGKVWKVEGVRFTSPPRVGRALHDTPQRVEHGALAPLPAATDAQGHAVPPSTGDDIPGQATPAPAPGGNGGPP